MHLALATASRTTFQMAYLLTGDDEVGGDGRDGARHGHCGRPADTPAGVADRDGHPVNGRPVADAGWPLRATVGPAPRTETPARSIVGPAGDLHAERHDNVRAPTAEALPTWAAPVALAARAEHATKLYGRGDNEVLALDDVTVGLPAGRFTAVMGPSGSGKSTLMHCLAGLDSLTSGRVFLGDIELGSLSDRELTRVRRERIGFVFQAFNLLPTLDARENITLPMSLAGTKPNKEWVRTVVEVVGLSDRLKHRPSELSGGQQQRVAVARAMASMPS